MEIPIFKITTKSPKTQGEKTGNKNRMAFFSITGGEMALLVPAWQFQGYPVIQEREIRLLDFWKMDIGINEEDLNQLLDFSFVIFYSSIPYL
ncbi:hypothetical protein ES707_19859 [subsurface metagenome]